MQDMVYFTAPASVVAAHEGLKPEYRSQPGRLRRPGRGLNAREGNQTTAQSAYAAPPRVQTHESYLCCDDQLNLGWLREHSHGGRARRAVASVVPAPAAFVAIAVPPASPVRARGGDDSVAMMNMQARLPNGVAIDLRGVQVRHVCEVIEALGRLRCSASTKT